MRRYEFSRRERGCQAMPDDTDKRIQRLPLAYIDGLVRVRGNEIKLAM